MSSNILNFEFAKTQKFSNSSRLQQNEEFWKHSEIFQNSTFGLYNKYLYETAPTLTALIEPRNSVFEYILATTRLLN